MYEIKGPWKDGWVLDNLFVSEKEKPYNDDGSINLNAKRTELGKLLFELKHFKKTENIYPIGEIIYPFINKILINNKIEAILVIPSTKKNNYMNDVLNNLKNRISIPIINENNLNLKKYTNILLFDDTYKTGETFTRYANLVLGKTNNIFVLALIKFKKKSTIK